MSRSGGFYVSVVIAAKQAGVTALSVADATVINEHVAADCTTQGFTPWYLTGDGSVTPSLLKSPGLDSKTIGFETDIPYWVNNTPATQKYHKLMNKYEASDLKDPNYNELAVGTYVAGLIIETALKAGMAGKSGPVSTKTVYKGLYSAFHGNTLGGMAPPSPTRRASRPPSTAGTGSASRTKNTPRRTG